MWLGYRLFAQGPGGIRCDCPNFGLSFANNCYEKEEVYILAGDESVVSKAGKRTYGLDRFFSGLQQKVIPSLSFFVFSLVSVKGRRSYPVCVGAKRYTTKKKKQPAKRKESEKSQIH